MFELHITSSKDIKTLNIEFCDGTVVNSKAKEAKNDNIKDNNIKDNNIKKENIPKKLKKDIKENLNVKNTFIEDIINQPKKSFNINDIVDIKDRPTNVAKELDNLDI